MEPGFDDVQVTSDERISPGVYFSWDQEAGDVAIDMRASRPGAFSVRATVQKTPEWFSLNFSLGSGGFEPGSVLGLLVQGQSSQGLSTPVFVRSAQPEAGYEDTPLSDPLHILKRFATSAVLHVVQPEDPLTWPTAFHTLVVQLPPTDFDFELHVLKVFTLPAGQMPILLEGAIANLTR